MRPSLSPTYPQGLKVQVAHIANLAEETQSITGELSHDLLRVVLGEAMFDQIVYGFRLWDATNLILRPRPSRTTFYIVYTVSLTNAECLREREGEAGGDGGKSR